MTKHFFEWKKSFFDLDKFLWLKEILFESKKLFLGRWIDQFYWFISKNQVNNNQLLLSYWLQLIQILIDSNSEMSILFTKFYTKNQTKNQGLIICIQCINFVKLSDKNPLFLNRLFEQVYPKFIRLCLDYFFYTILQIHCFNSLIITLNAMWYFTALERFSFSGFFHNF